ncbi:hypothetical protein PAHAL_9G120700 [Panicum hallii]|uniref:EamA domain-containing protein n=2 Tax=Panicum hallii TaxID=206008 RepID=A0A2T8I0Y8_9POAL|nr:hypothetical protein PAHAL_9G120700 [Panicum hallii]
MATRRDGADDLSTRECSLGDETSTGARDAAKNCSRISSPPRGPRAPTTTQVATPPRARARSTENYLPASPSAPVLLPLLQSTHELHILTPRAFFRRLPSYFTRPPTTARVTSGTTTCSLHCCSSSSSLRMASSIASASWALPLQTGGSGAGVAAAAGPSCRVLLAVAAPRSAASLRRARVLVAPRCAALEGPGGGGEEEAKIGEEGKSEEGKKRARGRPVWRRILFASKKTRSIIILNALTVIYASDIPVLKEVEALTEPAVFNMVRFVVAAIPFVPFAVRAFGDRRVRNAGLELGVWVSLAYLAQAIGLLSSDASRASFITAFTVIVVPLIDGLLGTSVPKLTWFGAIVSLLGIGLLECGGSPPCVGDVLNFFSAVFFGIHMLRTEQISRSTDRKNFLALLSFEVLVVAFSSILWFMFKDGYVDTSESRFESWTFGMLWDTAASFPWIPALYTGVLSTVLCMWAEMVAMGDVSATETAIVYGLEPVWGATFAWFLLGERWDNAAWIGAALVLCGSLTVQLFGAAPEKSKKVEKRNRNALETPVKRQDYLSLSLIPVDSRKIIGRQLERKDKTL